MSNQAEVDRFVAEYGERYRKVIRDALEFLDSRELAWDLDTPINREEYIRALLWYVKKPAEANADVPHSTYSP